MMQSVSKMAIKKFMLKNKLLIVLKELSNRIERMIEIFKDLDNFGIVTLLKSLIIKSIWKIEKFA